MTVSLPRSSRQVMTDCGMMTHRASGPSDGRGDPLSGHAMSPTQNPTPGGAREALHHFQSRP